MEKWNVCVDLWILKNLTFGEASSLRILMLQLQQKTHLKVSQLDKNMYSLGSILWLSHTGTWCEADEFSSYKAELYQEMP